MFKCVYYMHPNWSSKCKRKSVFDRCESATTDHAPEGLAVDRVCAAVEQRGVHVGRGDGRQAEVAVGQHRTPSLTVAGESF